MECLDKCPEAQCTGKVELRESLSGTGAPIPRCDGHWAKRLELQRSIEKRYPVHQPADFDESYAGERWDED